MSQGNDQPGQQAPPATGEQGAASAPPPPRNGRSQALLVVTGLDHPGILDDISHYVGDRGAAIEAVRVVNLRGRFALIMLLAAAEEALRMVSRDLHLLCERTGVRATLEAPHDPEAGHIAGTSFDLNVNGGTDADESVVIRQLSNLLRVLNINIRDVETRRLATGGFAIGMEIDVPRDVPVGKLRELLGQLLAQNKVHWELSAAPGE